MTVEMMAEMEVWTTTTCMQNKQVERQNFSKLPHQESNQPLYKFVTSVDHVEALTGIDFFPELDDEVENKIEALSDYKIWSLKD